MNQSSLSRSLPPPALFALLCVASVCGTRAVLDDGDTYTHLAAGAWMLTHGAVLRTDPFSATFAGQAWTAHEWLSELLLGWVAEVAGLTGVVLLTAGALGLAFWNLARHVGARCSWAWTLLLVGGAYACVAPSILARPHVLALPVLELWVAALLRARDAGRAPPTALLALMTVWANLHGGWAFGCVFVAVLAAEATLALGWRAGLRWWAFVAAALGAACVTPLGWDGLVLPVRLLGMQSLTVIKEWQPATLSTDAGLLAAIAGLVALLLSRRVALGMARGGLLAALVYLALAHERHAVLFGIAGALLLAGPVGRAFEDRALVPAGGRFGRACWCGVALVALLRIAVPVGWEDGRATPVSALAYARPTVGGQPVLNSNQFGGYLALKGVPPFIDGRVELFGDAFVGTYLAFSEGNGSALTDGMARYRFGWALLAVDDPLVAQFDRLPGWRRSFSDDVAIVFVPNDSTSS